MTECTLKSRVEMHWKAKNQGYLLNLFAESGLHTTRWIDELTFQIHSFSKVRFPGKQITARALYFRQVTTEDAFQDIIDVDAAIC